MNRLEFLKGVCASAALSGFPARVCGAAKMLGKPDLVIGVLSDVHIQIGPKTDPLAATALFRHALEYFRDRHVDGVLIAGDLADKGLETELKAVADAWFAVFPNGKLPDGSPVANLMHYGDHDVEPQMYSDKLKASFEKAGVPLPRSLSQCGVAKECWEKFFHEPWLPLRHVKVKGYDFILSSFVNEGSRSAPDDLGLRLLEMNLNPDKPFFYSQHRYIRGTYLSNEEMWGSDNNVSGKVLVNHPNCIAFQGHTHYMLTDPRGVWIDKYVTINTGALQSAPCGRVRENGINISWYKNDYMLEKEMPCLDIHRGHGGSVVSVKGDLVTIERRDFGYDRSLGPDIVFSMDGAQRSAVSDAVRKVRSIAPQFPDGARVSVSEGIGEDRRKRQKMQVTVSFPTVRSQGDRPRAHEYFVRAESENGMLLKEKRVYSPKINLPECQDADISTCVFSKSEIKCAGKVRYSVRPANCWGVCGRSIVTESHM